MALIQNYAYQLYAPGSYFTHTPTKSQQLRCLHTEQCKGSYVLHTLRIRSVCGHCVRYDAKVWAPGPSLFPVYSPFYWHFILCCSYTFSQRSNRKMHNAKIYSVLTNRASFASNRWIRATDFQTPEPILPSAGWVCLADYPYGWMGWRTMNECGLLLSRQAGRRKCAQIKRIPSLLS